MNTDLHITVAPDRMVQEDLETHGYTRRPLHIDADVARALQAMTASAWSLPRDEYFVHGDRFRRLTRLGVTVTSYGLSIGVLTDASHYYQPATYNPELGGAVRKYQPHDPELVQMPGLAKMIAHHIKSLPGSAPGTRYEVNFHVIRFFATPGRPGQTSPAGLHKDGEKYIASHLLACCGVNGGEVVIADNDKVEIDRFTLSQMGDCYLIDDDEVWHMLTPVTVSPGSVIAFRDICLLDILPQTRSSN